MKGRIIIDENICKGCGFCIEACPLGVISRRDCFNKCGYFPAYVVRPEACKGCALCATMCPEIAITVFRNNSKPASSRRTKKR